MCALDPKFSASPTTVSEWSSNSLTAAEPLGDAPVPVSLRSDHFARRDLPVGRNFQLWVRNMREALAKFASARKWLGLVE
jgi:hypothetical protein